MQKPMEQGLQRGGNLSARGRFRMGMGWAQIKKKGSDLGEMEWLLFTGRRREKREKKGGWGS